jgi:hypothetical protein
MITEFRLGNFKAFGETQRVPIKPITLIFGPNSGGKSSIIHSLALIHESNRTGELDLYLTQLGGSSIDLGGFRQYVHRGHTDQKVEWGMKLYGSFEDGKAAPSRNPPWMPWLTDDEIRHILPKSSPMSLSRQPTRFAREVSLYIGLPTENGYPSSTSTQTGPSIYKDVVLHRNNQTGESGSRVLKYVIGDGLEPILELEYKDGQFLIRNSNLIKPGSSVDDSWQAIVCREHRERLDPELFGHVRRIVKSFEPEILITAEKLLPNKVLKSSSHEVSGRQWNSMFFGSGSNPSTMSVEDHARFYIQLMRVELGSLLEVTEKTIDRQLRRLNYLGPLRSFPRRKFDLSEHDDPNWFAGGGYAWQAVKHDSEIRTLVNAWLGSDRLDTRYKFEERQLTSLSALEKTFRDRSNDTIKGLSHHSFLEMLLREGNLDFQSELILVDQRTGTEVTHRDVGIGLSQIIPVLVGAYGSTDRIIAIEQPEIHLHPALQAELADVFIESALGKRGNTFILETHSEHLILRILRRVRQTTKGKAPDGLQIRADQLAVLYVQPSENGAVVIELPVTEEGEFDRPWPGGFFEERADELFSDE